MSRGGRGSKNTASAKTPDTYVSYGFDKDLLNAVPELKQLVDKASSQGWDIQRFQDSLQTTKWWQENSDTAKKIFTMQYNDPAEYQQQLAQAKAHVQQMAANMGVTLTAAQIASQANLDLWQGMNDASAQSAIGAMYQGAGSATPGVGGTAVTLNQQIMSLAHQYGVPVTQSWVDNMVKTALTNSNGTEAAQASLSSMAQSVYPGLAQQLAAGQTTEQIAQPYVASMAQILEMDPSSINLNDPTIQKALQATQLQQQGATGSAGGKSSSGANAMSAVSTPSIVKTGGTSNTQQVPGAPSMGAGATPGAPPSVLGSAATAASNNAANSGTATSPSSAPGITPGMMPLYQFQNMLRQDPRWQQTDGAKQSAYSMLHQLGSDFGFAP